MFGRPLLTKLGQRGESIMRVGSVHLLLGVTLLCFFGCGKKDTEIVVEMVANQDIRAGTTINTDVWDGEFFKSGRQFVKGQQPPEMFYDNWRSLTQGKKVGRDLKRGEMVKRGDIVESDGTPIREPEK